MATTPLSFGVLLRTLRKRVGMTQGDLAAAVGYSVSAISALEQARRLPTVDFVVQQLIPALAINDAPQLATRLIELAAAVRGERPPTSVTIQRTAQVVIQEEVVEQIGRLPTLPTALIGRTAQVNQLYDRLLGHSGRLLTLVGPPGIGKTTLALAVAAQAQPHYRDGAVFVALAALTEPALMASTIATAVGCSDASPKPPQVRLIEFLRRKTMLLVLDNLEQLTGAGALIAELVAQCSGVCVLATSRERLHLRAEQRFKVPPLDLAPAVELFVQRAQAVDADFRLTPHNHPTIEAVCQRLDCLPLALELCAAQIDLFAPAQLLTQLQARRLDLLVDGAQDLPPQHRTLRAAIQRSYALLNEGERTLFRTLGVFVGSFALPAVAAIMAECLADDTLPPSLVSTFHSLIGKSLVRAETLPSGEQRFLILETIREFALEQLRAQGEEAHLRQRHYATYLQIFRTGDSHLRGAEAAAWVARLEPDQDNLRAALQWTLDEARYADAAWLMVAVHYLWFLRGARYEGANWLTQLLPRRQILAIDLRLATLICFYATTLEVKDFPPVDDYRNEVIELVQVCGDKLLQASAWFWLAWSATDVGQSVALIEQCIALARAASEAPGLGAEFCLLTDCTFVLASTLEKYAVYLIDQGEVARAAPVATESLAFFRMRGIPNGIGDCLGSLGRIALLQGDLAGAHRLFQEVMTIAISFNLRPTQSDWQPLLGLVMLYRGDVPEARRLLSESLRLCLELKNKFILAQVYTYLAELALWEGEGAQAAHWLAQSLAQQTDAGRLTIFQIGRLWMAARLATAQQQYQRAAMLFGLADEMHRQLHYVIAGPMRALADEAFATAQAALEPAVFIEAFSAGQQLPLEEAFATLLTPPAVAPQSRA